MKKTGQRMPRKSRVSVANIEGLLLSASRAHRLVTIHREIVDADICHIGHVVDVKDGTVSLLEIGPDAKWEDNPTAYRFKDITRVDFGGGYENDAMYHYCICGITAEKLARTVVALVFKFAQ